MTKGGPRGDRSTPLTVIPGGDQRKHRAPRRVVHPWPPNPIRPTTNPRGRAANPTTARTRSRRMPRPSPAPSRWRGVASPRQGQPTRELRMTKPPKRRRASRSDPTIPPGSMPSTNPGECVTRQMRSGTDAVAGVEAVRLIRLRSVEASFERVEDVDFLDGHRKRLTVRAVVVLVRGNRVCHLHRVEVFVAHHQHNVVIVA